MTTSAVLEVNDSNRAALFEGDALWHPTWKESTGEATLKVRSKDPETKPDLILYSSWFCPFAQRAWIAAEESGVNYKWMEINPYQLDPEKPGGYSKLSLPIEIKKTLYPSFVKASPRGLVPAITDSKTGKHLWESMPVAEYIDAVFNEGKLLLKNCNDPYLRAQLQVWTAHCTERVSKEFFQALTARDDDTQKAALEQLFKECRAIARAMDKDGPFFAGSEFSIVDIALAPFWQLILIVGEHYMNLKVPVEEPEFIRLDKWWQATKERSCVKSTMCCPDRLISTYADYRRGVATSDATKSLSK